MQNKLNKNHGFTLIELIIVIVILGVLAVTAAPKFLDFSSDARRNVIENLRSTLESQNELLRLKAQIPDSLIQAGPQFWLDINNNGVVDGDSNPDQNTTDGKDGIDILLMANLNIDNYQLTKIIDLSEGLVISLGPQNHQAYIGFDRRGDGDIRAGNCRVYYDQTSFRMVTTGC